MLGSDEHRGGQGVIDPAVRALARTVRDHLLANETDPLPASLGARLSGSSGSERVGLLSAVVTGFGEAVGELIRDELIEPDLEERLLRVATDCGIRASDLDVDAALSRLARAAAKREVLRGELPSWHVGARGLVSTSPHAVWVFPDLQVHAREPGEVPRTWAAWAHSDRVLEEGLGRIVDLRGYEPVGRGRLVVESEGVRLDSPGCWLHLALRAVRATELRSDGVILHADERRLALIEGDGWFLGELLRLVRETTGDSRPAESPPHAV